MENNDEPMEIAEENLINNNDNQVEQNPEQHTLLDCFSQKDCLNISLDLIPSSFYALLIFFAFRSTPIYCELRIFYIFRIMFTLYTLFILKGVFSILQKIYLPNKSLVLSIIDVILNLAYYIFVFILLDVYVHKPNSCFYTNTFTVFVLFIILFLGLINICLFFLNLIINIFLFPFLLNAFFKNPNKFYSVYGIDPEIVDNIPSVKATANHCTMCVICTEEIQLNDDIIILRCQGKHCFHANCIKDWLKVKVICPTCRSDNVL